MKKIYIFILVSFSITTLLNHSYAAVEVKLKGQINRMIMSVNNGNTSVTHHVDNINSGSRFEIEGTQSLPNKINAGLALQWRVGSNRSDEVNFTRRESITEYDNDLRRSEIWLSYKNWGRISIGKGNGASNGTSEVDLSGTEVISYSRAHVELLGNMELYGADFDGDGKIESEDLEINSSGGQQFQVNNVRRFIDSFDGLGYQDRLRYDSPKLGVFDLAFSLGQGGSLEAALRSAEYIGNSRVAFAAGIFRSGNIAKSLDSRFSRQFDFYGASGSISILLYSGLNLSFASSFISVAKNEANISPVDGVHIYAKLGYKTDQHAISIDFSMGNSGYFDNAPVSLSPFVDTKINSYSLSYVYNLVDGVDIYTSFRNVSLSEISQNILGYDSVKSINAIFVGSRVRF